MLVDKKNFDKLKEYVDMNDTETIQCDSNHTKACYDEWKNEIDAFIIRDVF